MGNGTKMNKNSRVPSIFWFQVLLEARDLNLKPETCNLKSVMHKSYLLFYP